MTISIETGPEFDRRLAELAWEHADDLTKRSLAGTVALAIASDTSCLQSLKKTASAALVEYIVAEAKESDQIAEASKLAVEAACKQLPKKSEQNKLLSSHLKAASKSIRQVILEEAKRVIAPHIVEEATRGILAEGIVEAVKSILVEEKGLLRTELYSRIDEALNAIKTVSDEHYKTVLGHIRSRSPNGNWP